ncbi:hypothetical protein JOC85_002112 [Bacillus mesophilus]|nr:hypothetical protein [Bacillus mesophilus]
MDMPKTLLYLFFFMICLTIIILSEFKGTFYILFG